MVVRILLAGKATELHPTFLLIQEGGVVFDCEIADGIVSVVFTMEKCHMHFLHIPGGCHGSEEAAQGFAAHESVSHLFLGAIYMVALEPIPLVRDTIEILRHHTQTLQLV
jgi:hypothetical protein